MLDFFVLGPEKMKISRIVLCPPLRFFPGGMVTISRTYIENSHSFADSTGVSIDQKNCSLSLRELHIKNDLEILYR